MDLPQFYPIVEHLLSPNVYYYKQHKAREKENKVGQEPGSTWRKEEH